jgi:hypothetical protein
MLPCRGVLYQCQYVRIWVNAVEVEGEGDNADSSEDELSNLISKFTDISGKKQALQVTAAIHSSLNTKHAPI